MAPEIHDPQLRCADPVRRQLLDGSPGINGIDFLEVIDREAPVDLGIRQRTLVVRCFHAVASGVLNAARVRIEGGVRVTAVRALWAAPLPEVLAPGFPHIPGAEQTFFSTLFAGEGEPDHLLLVRTDSDGDFSTYQLRLVTSTTDLTPPPGFDPRLSSVPFSFKVECPSDFDCKPRVQCREEVPEAPVIDYLARDYTSFRQLMLDRMAVTLPQWRERHAADLGVALVEALAASADHLSYTQDAVATEAYLGTARRRTSVRRHARLLDYRIDDGANARTWVHITYRPAAAADDDALLPGPDLAAGLSGTPLLSRGGEARAVLSQDELAPRVAAGALVFETLEPVVLRHAHNTLTIHTWGDEDCCLPRGATGLTLRRHADDLGPGATKAQRQLDLAPGDVILLEEVRGPHTGRRADADRSHRHVVRLSEVRVRTDPLFPSPVDPAPAALEVLEVSWDAADALPFPLCLWQVADPDAGGASRSVSVARGNLVLADHGRTLGRETLPLPTDDPRSCPLADGAEFPYRPALRFGPLTHQAQTRDGVGNPIPFDPTRSATEAIAVPDAVGQAALRVWDVGGEIWRPRADLLASDRFARELVAETETDGSTRLRFGDGIVGRRPAAGLEAVYRVGNGRQGNVGAGALRHLVVDPQRLSPADILKLTSGIVQVTNPLPAAGGRDPESLERVRLDAPQAFRVQERAVTADDYAAVAQRHPEVQRAAATLRWTGSWTTVFLTLDRTGGRPIDGPFEATMRRFMERFRLAAFDLEIDGPRFVPLDIVISVCVETGYFRADVHQALLDIFSHQDLADGRRGFFHPDRFTFGQPVYLSQVVATAMEIPGVSWVDTRGGGGSPHRFQRWGRPPAGELDAGILPLARLEIARLDNDPNAPENGRIQFLMKGGA